MCCAIFPQIEWSVPIGATDPRYFSLSMKNIISYHPHSPDLIDGQRKIPQCEHGENNSGSRDANEQKSKLLGLLQIKDCRDTSTPGVTSLLTLETCNFYLCDKVQIISRKGNENKYRFSLPFFQEIISELISLSWFSLKSSLSQVTELLHPPFFSAGEPGIRV